MRPTLTILAAAAAGLLLAGCAVPEEPTAVQPAESGKSKAAAKKSVPIKLTAVRAKAKASVLSDGGALSCAKVTVTNQSKKNVEVNPYYFSLTDTTGQKRNTDDAMADYEGSIDSTTLAPGERATGLVCGKGKWTPKVVTMTDPLFSEAVRAEVG